jgi:hypothetical protein
MDETEISLHVLLSLALNSTLGFIRNVRLVNPVAGMVGNADGTISLPVAPSVLRDVGKSKRPSAPQKKSFPT